MVEILTLVIISTKTQFFLNPNLNPKSYLLGLNHKSKIWCNKVRLHYPPCYPFYALILIWVFNPHHLHCTWLGCIRSCREDSSHGFLIEWQVVQSIHGYGNPSKTIVHYLIIGGMTCLGHRDGSLLVNTLVYVMHLRLDLQWITI